MRPRPTLPAECTTGTPPATTATPAFALAAARVRALERQVTLIQGDAQALPITDGTIDTVVCTLGLSSIPDQRAAVAEMFRVLRPGGTLRLLGHVPSPWAPARAIQRLLERQSVALTGDRQSRPVLPAVIVAGFAVTERRRSRLGIIERLTATKPGTF
jgi:ubiquinone/menaquinone biosynthesis C-methylase UbiE